MAKDTENWKTKIGGLYYIKTYVNASGHSTSTYYYNRKYNSWKAILDADYMKATVFPVGMTIII